MAILIVSGTLVFANNLNILSSLKIPTFQSISFKTKISHILDSPNAKQTQSRTTVSKGHFIHLVEDDL